MTDTTDLSEHDLKALRECVAIQRTRGRDRADQLDTMLRDRAWFDAALFACYSVQISALRLKPWQMPPCDAGGDTEAEELLRQMLAAGVSAFDPNPMSALKAAGRSKKGGA